MLEQNLGEHDVGDVVPVPNLVLGGLRGISVMLAGERTGAGVARRHDVLLAKTEDEAKVLAEESVGDNTHTVVAQVKLRSKKRRAGSLTADELLDPTCPEYSNGSHRKKALYMVIPREKDNNAAIGHEFASSGSQTHAIPWIRFQWFSDSCDSLD